jgi:transposase
LTDRDSAQPTPQVFRNATIILMSAVGRSKASIAFDLGCSIGTVDLARRHYRESGPKDLIRGKPSQWASWVTPEYRAALRSAVETPPQDLGYGFSVWLPARLNAHLLKRTGVRFSESQLGRVMKPEGVSFERPKHTIRGKGDEAAFQKATPKLRGLKKNRPPRTPNLR